MDYVTVFERVTMAVHEFPVLQEKNETPHCPLACYPARLPYICVENGFRWSVAIYWWLNKLSE